MALGLIHVRGRLCKYESKAKGNRRASSKAGKFVACRPAGKRGYVVDSRSTRPKKSGSKKRGSVRQSGDLICRKVKVRGKCRKICTIRGKIRSNDPAKGCR